jgi:hypothetical protein
LIIGASLESRIELGPPGADELGQTILGKTQVQAAKPFSCLPAQLLEALNHQLLLIHSLRTGNSADDMPLYQCLERDLISNSKEDKILKVLLHPYHDISLDVVEV